MSQRKNCKTKTEKLKEEKNVAEKKLTKAEKKQEQTDQQLQRAENLADLLKDNERRSGALRLAIKGAILEGIAPRLKYCTDQELYDLMDYVFPFRRCRDSSWNSRKNFWRKSASTQQALAEIQRVPVCMKRRFRCAA